MSDVCSASLHGGPQTFYISFSWKQQKVRSIRYCLYITGLFLRFTSINTQGTDWLELQLCNLLSKRNNFNIFSWFTLPTGVCTLLQRSHKTSVIPTEVQVKMSVVSPFRHAAVCCRLSHRLHDVGGGWWQRRAKRHFQGPPPSQPFRPEALPGTANLDCWCRIQFLSHQLGADGKAVSFPDHPHYGIIKLIPAWSNLHHQ